MYKKLFNNKQSHSETFIFKHIIHIFLKEFKDLIVGDVTFSSHWHILTHKSDATATVYLHLCSTKDRKAYRFGTS